MKYILVLLTLVTLSCNTKTNDLRAKNSETTNSQQKVESFDEFFEKFKSDSTFQIDRVTFPFQSTYLDLYDNKQVDKKIEITDWQHLDFEYKDEYAKRDVDAYTQEAKTSSDSVKIEIRGIDNGIYVDFVFKIKDGKWFLVSRDDYST